MKTKEELTALKAEVEALNNKLNELTEEELKLVTGGLLPGDTAFRPAKAGAGVGTDGNVGFDVHGPDGEKEFHVYEGTVKRDFIP